MERDSINLSAGPVLLTHLYSISNDTYKKMHGISIELKIPQPHSRLEKSLNLILRRVAYLLKILTQEPDSKLKTVGY